MTLLKKVLKVALVLALALLLKYVQRIRDMKRLRGPGRKRFDDMPHAGMWYLWLLFFDNKNYARKLYNAYKHHGLVKITGFTLRDEVMIFNLDDCHHCHMNEGLSPGGAGDILFERQTKYFGSDNVDCGLAADSHGRRMFGRGHGHNLTRALSEGTPMRSSPIVLETARRSVDFVEHYPTIMDWIKYHQIDMFMSVMIGRSTDLANPATKHPLRNLPEDEEHAFVSGLILSMFPKWMMTSLDKAFVKAMDNMTGMGVKELRERFFSLPPEQRPDSYMKSLLEHGNEQDAEQLMALFITAFQGNISLTLQNLIFHVSNHPEVQEKLHQECTQAYNSDDPIIFPMPYLAAIRKESHRMTPITDYTQVREYDRDLLLPSGWPIPAGVRVQMLNKWSTRDPDLVPDVDKFIPERFLGAAADQDKNLTRILQISEFGSSSRACLGRRTARVMLRAIIVELFHRYRLEASPARTTFQFETRDPAFNRIADFPKIILHRRT